MVSKAGLKAKRPATCGHCGAAIEVEGWRLARFAAVYCGRGCAGAARRKVQTVPCAVCRSPVTRKPSRILSGDTICENPDCRAELNSRKAAKVPVPCAGCGSVVEVFPSRARRNANAYCSVSCRSAHIVGANNPAFTGGLGRRRNYGPRWRSTRAAILKRDGYRCQRCGFEPKERRRLDVHHKRPYHRFGGDWEAANDPSNLTTLCRPCHRWAEANP